MSTPTNKPGNGSNAVSGTRAAAQVVSDQSRNETTERVRATLKKRYLREKIFRGFGVAAIVASLGFLVLLLSSIFIKGYPAFQATYIQLDIPFTESELDIASDAPENELRRANYKGALRSAIRERFPDVTKRGDLRDLYELWSSGAEYALADHLMSNRDQFGQSVPLWVLADDEADALIKRNMDLTQPIKRGKFKDDPDALVTRLNEEQLIWLQDLQQSGDTDVRWSKAFFENGNSREAEQAGIRAALIGSAYTLLITFLLSFPMAVAAAIYLEEFAPQNRWTDIVEVNINNLAAVPSIVFGLLGLAVFINYLAMPRSAPLVGGIVLSLMTLPTIIISSRAALKAVPPSIREAARGLGASPVQVVTHHVLPLAMPGILTGTIIGLAQALGETAPLLMIGMVAFIVDIPQSVTDPSTVLPVQVFLWADAPERAFTERTSGAILVLLAFLIVMNLTAVILRKRFERRW